MSERVVRVWCGQSNKVGSGYRVDARHVLTARHVVDAQDCLVRLDGETEYRVATVIWLGLDNIDIVVLQLVEEPPLLADRDPIWASCRWVDGECRAAGYPEFLNFEDGSEREEFVGELRPLAGIERGRIHAAGNWAENREPEQWGGMSGAALFSGGYLIGVVTESMPDRLWACPVSKLFEDEAFRQMFPEFCFDDTVLWPVSDQPALRQLRPWTRRRTGMLARPPSELLLAHNEVVPFDDSLRTHELARLEAFSVDRGPAMLVFTGPGGAGKTRLMIAWCARMRERGWVAGFVRGSHPDLARATEGETPRLLVVDYPEGRVNDVVELCRRAHAAVASVRLVLLARSKGPWFDELRQGVDSDIVTSATWDELDSLDDAQRRRTYKQAHAVFSDIGADQGDASPDELARDELPLFAHMRALLRAYGERETDERPERVLARVLEHERRHWAAQVGRLLGRPASPAMLWDLDRVLAVMVLFGGIDDALGDLLRWLRPELKQREREAFATCIAALYRRETRVIPLQPDSLGEQLVFEAISHAAEQDGARGIEWWLGLPTDARAPKGSVGQTLVVLTRLVDRKVEAARGWLRMFIGAHWEKWMQACVDQREHADPRGHELAAAVRVLNDVELAGRLLQELPAATVELLQLGVEVGHVLLKHAPQDESQESRHTRARLSINLGSYLYGAGRREEALEATQDAAEECRELSKAEPDAFLPTLAKALNNLGAMLSSLGRREEALEVTQDAVAQCRELARARPDEFRSHLASTLNNLGPILSELARREEALEAVQEAVEIRRELARARPDESQAHLASTLTNLGSRLSELGRREEALEATQEAVEQCRELAKVRRDAFLPDLAMALNNLGNSLNELGRPEEALDATQEAAEYYRELAKARRETFQPDLASTLNNLGNRLSELGHREEALKAALEAAEQYRELVEARLGAFQPDLAMALNNLGNRLSEMGRREEALEATQEALQQYRELAKARPESVQPDLSMAVNNLGVRLSNLGRSEEAVEAMQEAVEIRRGLAKKRRKAFLPDLASSLHNFGATLSELGRREEALEATQESVEIRRELAKERRDAFLPDLASSLHNLGSRLSELGQREEALEAMQEGVEQYRELAKARPDVFQPDLASALSDLGSRLSELGRREEALKATQEAVEIRREQAKARPGVFQPDLASALTNLGNRLSELTRPEQALEATQEAVEIRRGLAKARPDAPQPDLALALTNLGSHLSELDRLEEALEATQEAMKIRRALAKARPGVFQPYLASTLNNLAAILSELGRRGEALEAAQEVVEILRELAIARPDAFQPELARSLALLGAIQFVSDSHDASLSSLAEGLRILLPHYSRLQSAHAPVFTAIIEQLRAACEAGGLPVPADLRVWVEGPSEAE